MGRLEQRDELFTALGFLLDPLRRFIESEPRSELEASVLRARFDHESGEFHQLLVRPFCQISGLEYATEQSRICNLVQGFVSCFSCTTERVPLRVGFATQVQQVHRAIRLLPLDEQPISIPGCWPFTAYMKLRALFASAATTVTVFDPYVGPQVYYRYLCQVDPGVMSIVVTQKPQFTGTRGNELLAVCQAFQAERPRTHQVQFAEFHDRHLMVDGNVYSLGGSLKDAAFRDAYSIIPVNDDDGSVARTLTDLLSRAEPYVIPENGKVNP